MKITFKDKLAHLNFVKACKLIGHDGDKYIIKGGNLTIKFDEMVYFSGSMLSIDFGIAKAIIEDKPDSETGLKLACTSIKDSKLYKGALLSFLLEEKMLLGLSKAPKRKIPIESLSEEDLIKAAIQEREESALKDKMRLISTNQDKLYTDYFITNKQSGKTYRIAFHGWHRGESYCSCPDYRKNTLGTCKHIIYAASKLNRRFNQKIKKTRYQPQGITIYLKYDTVRTLNFLYPDSISDDNLQTLLSRTDNGKITDINVIPSLIQELEKGNESVIIYPDAETYINRELHKLKNTQIVNEIRKNPKLHILRNTLLNAELLPHQLDGIAFCFGAGRAVLADDMGLGKTIQGIGIAELFRRHEGISNTLIICPTSLKSQWKIEIERFSDLEVHLVLGSAAQRAIQYDNPSFFTICNYEQVLRDHHLIAEHTWDFIILDEGQRIKNWQTKTSKILKNLRSTFALVLTGTPLENKIDDLHSVVEFIDDQRLGPQFRFHNMHRLVDDKGKVLGYKNIDVLRKKLKPILIRRTRQNVLKDLPERTVKIHRIPPTNEQLEFHDNQKRLLTILLGKKYFTEMDFLRLQKILLSCRMVANSTFLIDKKTHFSTKINELTLILNELAEQPERKAILFSEWTTMLNLIEPILKKNNIEFVRLDGSVPQKKRQAIVNTFQKDSKCQLFLTTNAGSTGLNLQAADTVINVDLPWNPAILEQRIARAHRMGQKKAIHVILLVTEQTLEENLLGTLHAKQQLSLAVLDPDSSVDMVSMESGIDALKNKLEILLGQKPPEPVNELQKQQTEDEQKRIEKNKKISSAGGALFTAAFKLIGEMLPQTNTEKSDTENKLAKTFEKQLMDSAHKEENGEIKLTLKLPDKNSLVTFSETLAKIASLSIHQTGNTTRNPIK